MLIVSDCDDDGLEDDCGGWGAGRVRGARQEGGRGLPGRETPAAHPAVDEDERPPEAVVDDCGGAACRCRADGESLLRWWGG